MDQQNCMYSVSSKALKRNKVCEVEHGMWKRNEITEKAFRSSAFLWRGRVNRGHWLLVF